MTLKPTFMECASPEAIQAELKKARVNADRWGRRAGELEHLLLTREGQIQRGEWPPKEEK